MQQKLCILKQNPNSGDLAPDSVSLSLKDNKKYILSSFGETETDFSSDFCVKVFLLIVIILFYDFFYFISGQCFHAISITASPNYHFKSLSTSAATVCLSHASVSICSSPVCLPSDAYEVKG